MNAFYAGGQLTDKHINFAQKLVGSKHKDVYGLQLTLTLHKASKIPVRCLKNFLQITHCRINHWIVVSTILTHPKVTVYDSLFDLVDSNTTSILKKLFGPKVEVVVNNNINKLALRTVGYLQSPIAFAWQIRRARQQITTNHK